MAGIEKEIKPRAGHVCYLMWAVATANIMASPALAYHPLSTDDPGTTEYRHFELEWGNDFIWPEKSLEESSGYLAIKSGLAPDFQFTLATLLGW